jgi:hypothetical protein
MDITPYVAWYAAALSTAVFGWDVAKWSRSKPRVRVSARGPVCYPDGEVVATHVSEDGITSKGFADYCHIEIVNVGGQPSTLIDIQATHRTPKRSARMILSTTAIVPQSGCKSLPALLGPGELWSARLDLRSLHSIATQGAPVVKLRVSHLEEPIVVSIKLKAGALVNDG